MENKNKLIGLLGLAGIVAGTGCDAPEATSEHPDVVPGEVMVDQSPDNENEFYRVELGEGAYVSFGSSEQNGDGYAGERGVVDMLAVGGARLDRFLQIEGVAEASIAEIYYGLGGSVDQAPSHVKTELEQRTQNYNIHFKHGELLEKMPPLPLVEDSKPVVRRSEFCDSSKLFDFALRHYKVDGNRVYQRYTNKPRTMGVRFGPSAHVAGFVCNKETSDGTPNHKDQIEVSWSLGYMTGSKDGKGFIQGPRWWSRGAVLPDGHQAFYSVSIADEPGLISQGVMMETEPKNGEKRRYYSALFEYNL